MTTTTNKINGRVDGNIETFTKGTYNGIAILIRDKDGYVNATKLAALHSDNKRKNLKRFMKSVEMKEIIEYWKEFEAPNRRLKNESTKEMPEFYELLKIANDYRGVYIHPDLIHFVAQWVSIRYSFAVKHIMDQINDKVHEELNKQQLPDTVENSKPIFNEIAKSIAPNIQINNSSTWGYRDSPYELDSWEQDDLKRAVDEYKDIKERLLKAEQKIDEWSVFVRKYHPEFQK